MPFINKDQSKPIKHNGLNNLEDERNYYAEQLTNAECSNKSIYSSSKSMNSLNVPLSSPNLIQNTYDTEKEADDESLMVSQSMPCLSIAAKSEFDQQSMKHEASLQSQNCPRCHKRSQIMSEPSPHGNYANRKTNHPVQVSDRHDYENCQDLRFMNPRMYQDVAEMEAAGKCLDRECTNCYTYTQ